MKHRFSISRFILASCIFTINHAYATQKAVINVPIADLIGQQMHTIRPNEPTENAYNSIALCGGQTNSPYGCPRLHQLLYNDIVDVIKITDTESCISVAHVYYLIPSTTTPQTHYWTLRKNITLLDDLSKKKIPLEHLPDPIHFSDKNHAALVHPNIITLIEPHYDRVLHTTFSAGTRFVCVPTAQKKKSSTVKVFAIDHATAQEHTITIPHHKCIFAQHNKTEICRITDYVNLLKKWAHTKHGCIPYVWGGTSFSHPTHGNFKEIIQNTDNGDYSFYQYENDTSSPKSGFDCSGAIARAAQICGIPYFCKNTATIGQCLKPLTQEQQLMPGDLILIRGHVMVVSDINKHLLIEARSYSHGYGKLHEIPISQVFEEIQTYKDLTDAYFGKKIIKRKDKQGKVRDSFTNLQLFSMKSVWNT